MISHDPDHVASALKSGLVGILATDTIPGFHCLAADRKAVARIQEIKGRAPDKPLLMLCPDLRTVFSLLPALRPRVRIYAERCWPGPYTLVLPAGPRIPETVISADATVAIRIPADPWLREILDRVGAPLVSTSVNPADGAAIGSLKDAKRIFGRRVDFLSEAPGSISATNPEVAIPSALLNLCVWPPEEIRIGPKPMPAWDDF